MMSPTEFPRPVVTVATIVARGAMHRSPLVLRCLDDHRAGRRLPLDLISELD